MVPGQNAGWWWFTHETYLLPFARIRRLTTCMDVKGPDPTGWAAKEGPGGAITGRLGGKPSQEGGYQRWQSAFDPSGPPGFVGFSPVRRVARRVGE